MRDCRTLLARSCVIYQQWKEEACGGGRGIEDSLLQFISPSKEEIAASTLSLYTRVLSLSLSLLSGPIKLANEVDLREKYPRVFIRTPFIHHSIPLRCVFLFSVVEIDQNPLARIHTSSHTQYHPSSLNTIGPPPMNPSNPLKA